MRPSIPLAALVVALTGCGGARPAWDRNQYDVTIQAEHMEITVESAGEGDEAASVVRIQETDQHGATRSSVEETMTAEGGDPDVTTDVTIPEQAAEAAAL